MGSVQDRKQVTYMACSWPFTSKACSQGGGQRRVSRSRSQWALSLVREFGLCPEAVVQESKDCKREWPKLPWLRFGDWRA